MLVKYAKTDSFVVFPHKLWLTALCLLLVPSAKGSSVAVIVTNSVIMIAADGVETKTTNDAESFEPYCKIRSEGTTFYTAVGIYGIPEINFDLWTLAKDAIRRSKTVVGIYEVIQSSILDRLPAVVERSKTVDKETITMWLTGIPVIAIFLRVVRARCPSSCYHFLSNRQYRKSSAADKENAVRSARTSANCTPRSQRRNEGGNGFSHVGRHLLGSIPVGFVQELIQREISASKRRKQKRRGPSHLNSEDHRHWWEL